MLRSGRTRKPAGSLYSVLTLKCAVFIISLWNLHVLGFRGLSSPWATATKAVWTQWWSPLLSIWNPFRLKSGKAGSRLLFLGVPPSRNLPPKLRFQGTKPFAPWTYPQIVNKRALESFIVLISDEATKLRLDLLNLFPGQRPRSLFRWNIQKDSTMSQTEFFFIPTFGYFATALALMIIRTGPSRPDSINGSSLVQCFQTVKAMRPVGLGLLSSSHCG
jgi:hypothetical protein